MSVYQSVSQIVVFLHAASGIAKICRFMRAVDYVDRHPIQNCSQITERRGTRSFWENIYRLLHRFNCLGQKGERKSQG